MRAQAMPGSEIHSRVHPVASGKPARRPGTPRCRGGARRSMPLGSGGRNLGNSPGDAAPLARGRPPWSSRRRGCGRHGTFEDHLRGGTRDRSRESYSLVTLAPVQALPVLRPALLPSTTLSLVVNRPSVVPLEESTPGSDLSAIAFGPLLALRSCSAPVVFRHLDGFLLPRNCLARARLPTLGFTAFPTR